MGLHFLSGSFVAEVTQPSGLWALWSGYFLQEGLHQRRHSQTAAASPLCPCDEPLLTHTSTGYPPTLAGSFGSVSCGVTALFLWVLVHARFCLCPARVQSPFSPVLWKSCNQIPLAFPVRKIPWVFSVPLLGPQARSLTCGFKPSQRWVIFFCIIVLHFVGYPPGGYRIWFYHDCAPPAISCHFFFVFGHGVSFFGRFQHLPVCGCSTASCDFGAFAGGDEQNPSTPPSWTRSPGHAPFHL